jgi:cell division protein FtsI/penicillin-binding protein 2
MKGDSETQTLTMTLQEGLQGILIRGKTGTAQVSRIVVTQ